MSNTYFRVINTSHPKEDVAVAEHTQKLNNHLLYDYAGTNADLGKLSQARQLIYGYKIEVHSQSTSTTVKNHDFVITTVLLCEKETIAEQMREGEEV